VAYLYPQTAMAGFASIGTNIARAVEKARQQTAARFQAVKAANLARARAEAAPASKFPWGWIALALGGGVAAFLFVRSRSKKSRAQNARGSFRSRNRKWPYKVKAVLDDDSFLLVLPGGKKIRGRTHPLSLRKFPYKDKYGRLDLPHLRNALSRIPQSNLPRSLRDKLTKKARSILDRAQSLGKAA